MNYTDISNKPYVVTTNKILSSPKDSKEVELAKKCIKEATKNDGSVVFKASK